MVQPQTSALGQVGRRLLKDLPFTLFMALVGTVLSFLFNVLAMMVHYDGYAKVPPGDPVTGQGNLLTGSVFWFFTSMAVTIPIGYLRAHGMAGTLAALSRMPRDLGRVFERDGAAAQAHLLGGASVGMAMSMLVRSWAGAAVGLGLLASLVTVLGSVAVRAVGLVWSALVPGRRQARDQEAGPLLALMGTGIALLASLFLGGWARLGVGVLCAIAALALSLSGRPPTPAMLALGWLLLLEAAPAMAHDGGWWENQGGGSFWDNVKNWLNGGGLSVAGCGAAGAVSGGAGAGLGTAAGGAGAAPPPTPTAPPVSPPEKPEEVSETCVRLMEQHGAACSQLGGIAREIAAAEEAWLSVNREIENMLAFVRERRQYLKTIRDGWLAARAIRQMGLVGIILSGGIATAGMLPEAMMAVTELAKKVVALTQALGVSLAGFMAGGWDPTRDYQVTQALAAVDAEEEALNEHFQKTWERLGPMQREAEQAVDRLQGAFATKATEVRGFEAQMDAERCNCARCPYLAPTRVVIR